MGGASSIAEASYEELELDRIHALFTESSSESAEGLACAEPDIAPSDTTWTINAVSSEVLFEKLRRATGNARIIKCEDAKPYCEMHQMDAVRALCPQTCGCQVSWP